jgi:alkaline phosphatase D
MLGVEQREWLFSELETSAADWRLLASPSILIRTWSQAPPDAVKEAMLKLKLMDEDGEGPDEDQWDGYPAERSALLDVLAGLDDAVVLSADIHVSVASEVADDGEAPVAVEFTAPSLTSQNLDEKLGLDPRNEHILECEHEWTEALAHVHWCEMASHGYLVCDVDRDRVRAEWWHVDGVLEPTLGERRAATFEVRRGSPRLQAVR